MASWLQNDITLGDLLTLAGELVVAWVIYREVSASRETTFLTEVDAETSKARAAIYEKFVNEPGDTAAQKAEAFAARIRRSPDLRAEIERQMVAFSRGYVLLRSWLRPNLMLKWYPQVILKMWVVCHIYILRHDDGVFRWDTEMWSELVHKALRKLEVSHIERGRENDDLVIYSGQGEVRVSPKQVREIVRLARPRRLPKFKRAYGWAKWVLAWRTRRG